MDTSLRSYWEERKDFAYYGEAQRMVEAHCPDAKSIIDIGAGPILTMNDFKIKKRTVLDPYDWDIYQELKKDVNKIIAFFPGIEVEAHDVVLCLEVLEHIEIKKDLFVDKLFEIANKLVIISLPYKWRRAPHNDIDESTLYKWVPGRNPIKINIVQDNKYMIAAYKK